MAFWAQDIEERKADREKERADRGGKRQESRRDCDCFTLVLLADTVYRTLYTPNFFSLCKLTVMRKL